LTHGRLWGKHFNVGYAFSGDENNQLLQNFKKLWLNRKHSDMDMLIQAAVQQQREKQASEIPKTNKNQAKTKAYPPVDSVQIQYDFTVSTNVGGSGGTVKGLTPTFP
jgi:hypothetical protein